MSGIRYYALFLDHHTQFLWVYPLRRKCDLFSKFLHFTSYIKNQFKANIKAFQCDNGGEYRNKQFDNFFAEHGIEARYSCPHTSQQNGNAERMIRTINNAVRSLLLQAQLSPIYWVEALHVAAQILNITPSSAIQHQIPFTRLFKKKPSYEHLRVFGCLCFPNLNHSHLSKLSPRSTPCLFLGYPSHHRGYRCFDLKTKKIIVSRHVHFEEDIFPAAEKSPNMAASYHFLQDLHQPSPLFKSILQMPIQPQAQTPTVPPPASVPQPPSAEVRAQNRGHTMITRAKAGVRKPKQFISLLTTTKSPLPKSYLQALSDPNWNPSMTDEHGAMVKTRTWSLVPRPKGVNIIRCMWLYKHKFDENGVLRRHKSRLVANGNSQQAGVDFSETFSPVVKPATIRTVLNIGVSKGWPIHQLDVKNAFLQGELDETVYMHQPPGFVSKEFPDHVCKLHKAIYGLKQAPRAWNSRFARFINKLGFLTSKADTSLYVYRKGTDMAYILLYVDDILLTASSHSLLHRITEALKKEFPMTDMGQLRHFLGIKIDYNQQGLFMSQTQYAKDILERAGMTDCKPIATPVDLKSKLSANDGDPVSDPTAYRSLAGALQYLTFTRPDISYAVHQICLYMHCPRTPHFQALRRILRYIKGTLDDGIQLTKGNIDRLVSYSDADWGGCPDTRRSTSGYCVFLGPNLVSWSAKRQPTVSRSSSEAEYKGVANTVSELCWIRNLMLELGWKIDKASIVYCDNISSVYIATNPVKHQRTKHVELDLHFVREKVAVGEIKVIHVPASLQYADIFTKGLPTSLFKEFKTSLTIGKPNALTEGG